MGRHKTEPKPKWTEHGRRIIPDDNIRFCVMDEMNIAINGIDLIITGKIGNNILDNSGIRKIIIRIKNADNVARTHSYTFIHGIINPIILFCNVMETPIEFGNVPTYNFQSLIRRPAVNHPILNIFIGLP